MDRRSLFTRVLPAAIGWGMTTVLARSSAAAPGRSPLGLLHWMPYDNDLAPAGPQILRWLELAARRNPTLTIAVQADLPESGRLMRAVLGATSLDRVAIADAPEVTWLDTDHSADPQIGRASCRERV